MGYLSGVTQEQYYQGGDYGNYQFTSLHDIISQFMIVYVGENKIIPKIKRLDVAFHAQRALQELSFDTFKSCKSQEVTIPATLQMMLPQDYVNYTKVSWVDSAGIKHPLYPTSRTSNPPGSFITNSDEEFVFEEIVDLTSGSTNVVMDGLFYIPYATRVTGTKLNSTTGGPWVVTAFYHSSNTTVLTIKNGGVSGTAFVSDATVKEKITFHTGDGSFYPNYKDGSKVTNVSNWTTGDTTLTVSSTSDLNGLKVGMILEPADSLNHSANTVVVAIDDTSILLSKPQLTTNPTTSNTIYFRNPESVETTTWSNYKSTTPSENNNDDYEDDTYWPIDGRRYGLNPQHAQVNGSFYIDCNTGKIHFSSNISGKTVILDYISDSLGTDKEMQVHKFAEEAMYKCITHAILSTSSYGQSLVPRLTKEKFAAIRKTKLRLSNIKLEEITQIFRGKSKQIKH